MKPLPQWVSNGAVLGLQGGTEAVRNTLQQVEKEWPGNHSDVAAVWLQDWTGQRQFGGKNDLPRVGLWWNWEVNSLSLSISITDHNPIPHYNSHSVMHAYYQE